MTININSIISITATLIILNSIKFWSFLSHQMMLITFCKVSKNNDLHHDIDHLQNIADHHTCKVRAIIAAAIGALALVPVCFVVHLGQCGCYYAWGCSHINLSPITILILLIFRFDILVMKVCGYDLPFTGGSWTIGGRDCRRTRLWVPGREIDHEDGRSHLAIIMKSKADEDKCSPRYGATLTCARHGDREDWGCITVTVTVVLWSKWLSCSCWMPQLFPPEWLHNYFVVMIMFNCSPCICLHCHLPTQISSPYHPCRGKYPAEQFVHMTSLFFWDIIKVPWDEPEPVEKPCWPACRNITYYIMANW